MRDNRTKVITIVALIIAVIGLSVGFAAFASTLTINTGAIVNPTNNFSVKFASGITGSNGAFTEFSVTPTVAVQKTASGDAIAGTPEINNTSSPTIGNLSAAFTAPGQSVTYTFYVVNDGSYDAYLTNLVFNNASGANSFKKCLSNASSDNPGTQTLVDSVCNNITLTMSVGSTNNITSSTTLSNHLLLKNHYEIVTVTISYTGELYADGAFTVSFGDIGLNYRTIDEPETIPTADIIDDLIPTPEQLASSAHEYDESVGDIYFFAFLGDDDFVYFQTIGEEAKLVSILYNGMLYFWLCDDFSAEMGSEVYNNSFEALKWYVTTPSAGPSQGVEYNGLSSPISLSDFEGRTVYNQEYIQRVIDSFSN